VSSKNRERFPPFEDRCLRCTIVPNMLQFIPIINKRIFTGKTRLCLFLCCLALFLICGMAWKSHAAKLTFGRQLKIIVLDPGHGGHEHGARGPEGTLEKNVSLVLARVIADTCDENFRIVLTRTDDYWISIADRTAAANHAMADLFISIHTGGSFRHQAGGIGVYYHEEQRLTDGKEETSKTGASGGSIEPIPPTPWDRIQARYRHASRNLAGYIHRQLVERLHPISDKIQGLPILVLQGADMPAILVEIGYATNPSEEKAFKDSAFLSTTADAICRGIDDFFSSPAP